MGHKQDQMERLRDRIKELESDVLRARQEKNQAVNKATAIGNSLSDMAMELQAVIGKFAGDEPQEREFRPFGMEFCRTSGGPGISVKDVQDMDDGMLLRLADAIAKRNNVRDKMEDDTVIWQIVLIELHGRLSARKPAEAEKGPLVPFPPPADAPKGSFDEAPSEPAPSA